MTNVGSIAILYCTAIGKPIPRIQWYKDDTTVNAMSLSFQQTFLILVPTNIPHTTVYTCKETNYIKNKEYTSYASVTVIVKGKHVNVILSFCINFCRHNTLSSSSGYSCEW